MKQVCPLIFWNFSTTPQLLSNAHLILHKCFLVWKLTQFTISHLTPNQLLTKHFSGASGHTLRTHHHAFSICMHAKLYINATLQSLWLKCAWKQHHCRPQHNTEGSERVLQFRARKENDIYNVKKERRCKEVKPRKFLLHINMYQIFCLCHHL